MSLEAVKTVAAAEAEATARKADTAAECKRLLADAEARGRALLDGALSLAAKKEAEVTGAAEADAEKQAENVLKQAEAEAKKLESGASSKIKSAAAFIVEKIVKS